MQTLTKKQSYLQRRLVERRAACVCLCSCVHARAIVCCACVHIVQPSRCLYLSRCPSHPYSVCHHEHTEDKEIGRDHHPNHQPRCHSRCCCNRFVVVVAVAAHMACELYEWAHGDHSLTVTLLHQIHRGRARNHSCVKGERESESTYRSLCPCDHRLRHCCVVVACLASLHHPYRRRGRRYVAADAGADVDVGDSVAEGVQRRQMKQDVVVVGVVGTVVVVEQPHRKPTQELSECGQRKRQRQESS